MRAYPSFVTDHAFYSMDSGQDIQAQQAGMLKNLKSVFDLTTRSYDSMDDMVRDYLNAGLEIFGLETGIVSRIENSTYTVVDVVSNQDVIKKGDVYPLEGTYCQEVYSCSRVLGFPHVGALPFMKEHPVYVNLQLESYLSAPIEVDEKLYGTLNFTSTQIRKNGFSEHERDLIVLMSRAISSFILLRERESKILETNKTLLKFVGFVAHDLRNPLGAIKGMADAGCKDDVPRQRLENIIRRIKSISELTIEFVHSILELSALGTGKIEVVKKEVDLSDVINTSVELLEDIVESRKSKIILKLKEVITVQADTSLLVQVFTNLLMNAIKYSEAGRDIVVTVSKERGGVRISIDNYVCEEAINRMSESERYRSVGFGLEIAKEIVSAHQSELIVEEKNRLFSASFILV